MKNPAEPRAFYLYRHVCQNTGGVIKKERCKILFNTRLMIAYFLRMQKSTHLKILLLDLKKDDTFQERVKKHKRYNA